MINNKKNKLILLFVIISIIIVAIISTLLIRKYVLNSDCKDNNIQNDNVQNDTSNINNREFNIANSDDARLFVIDTLKSIENNNYNLDIKFISEDDNNYNFVTNDTDGKSYDIILEKSTKIVNIGIKGNMMTGE